MLSILPISMKIATLCLNGVNVVATACIMLNDTSFKSSWVRTVYAEIYKYRYSHYLRDVHFCCTHGRCIGSELLVSTHTGSKKIT